MPKAIQVHETGSAEVLRFEEVEVGKPGLGEVLIRHTAIGVNFIDIYFRKGVYPAVRFPFIPGQEASGQVEALGPGVDDFQVGDRVAYAGPLGAYSEKRVIPADRLVHVPDSVDDRTAAAMMLKGMTAQYLLRRVYPVKAGDTILFHAIAGGVGLIACQWARYLGATVIGTVGSEAKAELAAKHGCHHTIIYTRENFVQKVKDITDRAGVPVVYDSVGKDTFMRSLDCLRPFGLMVSFGQSSGNVEPFDLSVLSRKGSLFLTRPTLMTYTAKREDLLTTARELFDVVVQGHVKIKIGQSYPLQDAANAHRALEARKTTGSTILLP
ncbi:MAG TPA: quinone oxidoreductase [Gammaproteobacteria bacterium]|nr:quinone oxidoreductase [Gammaproteobacteria bacterium]